MKILKNTSIFIILLTFISLSLICVQATDYDIEYDSYEIFFEYPGYFKESVTVLVPIVDEPNWNNIINSGVVESSNVKFSLSNSGCIAVTFVDENHSFAGKTFLFKRDATNCYEYDLIIENCTYYVELADTTNCFVVDSNYVDYAFEMPDNSISWQEYISNLTYPDNEHFYIYNDFVFFNDYALSYNSAFVTASDTVGLYIYKQSSNYHGHDWVDTRNVIQAPTCQRPLIIEQECVVCGNTRIFTDPSYQETSHEFVYLNGVSATCYDSGYVESQCTICGEKNFEILPQLNHRYNSVTCERDGICFRCGYVGYKALGHDLNWKGECSRCDYNENVVADWWNGKVVPGFKNAGESIGNFFGGLAQGGKEVGSDFIEYIIPGEDGNGLVTNLFSGSDDTPGTTIKKGFNILIAVAFGAVIIFIICKVAPYVVKFFDFLKSRKRKTRRRRKKKKKEMKKE